MVKLGAAGPDEIAAPGEEGEIVADMAGDEAFDGYWRRPDADASALRQGWYFTGDTGYLDADGDLFVTGRVDDMIISGGENVSPGEIESVLSLHPAVGEVAVAGLPDERWGQRIAAFIARREPVEPDVLDAWCRARRSPITSGRATTFSSPISQNRRSAKSCAGCWSRATIARSERWRRARASTGSVSRSTPRRERGDVVLDRPPLNVITMPQRDQLRAAFEALDADAAGADRRRAGDRRAFFQRRRNPRLPRSLARARFAARLEHRRASALRQAGDRRDPGLLLRGRVRAGARLRFPPRGGELPLCAARTAPRANPRLGRRGAAAEDGRHHPRQGHRHALAPAVGRQAYDWGVATECVPDAELEAATAALVEELRGFPPLAQRTAKKLLNDTEDATLSLAIELEGQTYSRLRSSDDFREGVEAFHAKRRPNFRGS